MGRNSKSGRGPLGRAEVSLLETLQEECLLVRTSLKNREGCKYHSLKQWVNVRAVPLFNESFHVADGEEIEKIYQWYKNHCSPPNVQVTPAATESSTPTINEPTNVSLRLPSIRDLVCRQYHDELRSSAQQAVRDSPDTNYMTQWNKAISTKVDSLSADERKRYQDVIDTEDTKRKHGPTKDDILASQYMLRQEITTAVRNLLGWGKKQYGDAMCFLTITFRNKEDVVTEERFLVSNEERFLNQYKPFLDRYDKCMDGCFSSIGEVVLPKHNINAFAKSMFIKTLQTGTQIFSPPDFESLKPADLRLQLKSFIEESWVKSDVGRMWDTVPWHLLGKLEPLTSPLEGTSITLTFLNLNPDTMEHHDLFRFANVVSGADHGFVFKKSAPGSQSTEERRPLDEGEHNQTSPAAQTSLPSPHPVPSHTPPQSPSQTPPGSPSQTPPGSPSRTPPGSPSQTPPGSPSRTPPQPPSRTPPQSPSRTLSEAPSCVPPRLPAHIPSSQPPSTSPRSPPSATPRPLPTPTPLPIRVSSEAALHTATQESQGTPPPGPLGGSTGRSDLEPPPTTTPTTASGSATLQSTDVTPAELDSATAQPQPLTEHTAVPVLAKKAVKQQQQRKKTESTAAVRSSSRVRKPPSKVAPLGNKGGKRTCVGDRYTWASVDSPSDADSRPQPSDPPESVPPQLNTSKARPRKKQRKN